MDAGTKLLHYRLIEKIGEGGMGVVWRALDTTLDREVAIKVLPPDLARDEERLARFDREAKLLASLNHPNIAGIYGIHRAETEGAPLHFLAMELVPGEDLMQRLERGPLPIETAVRIARRIATALEAAHESGVIHRDLKPANVKLAADDTIKVLDFGLAKAFEPAAASGDPSLSPTMTSAGTVAGMILGTAAYMSPEQAAGQPLDRRTDIWSFGVLFFELLTGTRLFHGETISHTLADVLRKKVDLSILPSGTPARVRRLIERCLERDPMRRLRDIGEARIALADDSAEDDAGAADANAAARRASRLPWLVASLATIVATAALATALLRSDAQPPPTVERFNIVMPNSGSSHQGDGIGIAISPDGRTIVTKGGAAADNSLYLRSLDDFEPWPLEGTTGGRMPQFSADGQWIVFYSSSSGMQKVRVTGGAAMPIEHLPISTQGYHWAEDGFIYYASEGQIWRIGADGGKPEQLSDVDEAQGREGYLNPYALPGGRFVLVNSRSGPGMRPTLFVLDTQSNEVKDLEMPGTDPLYLPAGFVVFAQSGNVVAAKFDADTLEFTGSPTTVLERAWIDQGQVQIAVADNGTVAYLPRQPGETQQLVWVDQAGKMQPVVEENLPFHSINDPRVSPDGKRAVFTVDTGAIWMLELRTETTTLLTDSGFYPLWSPDGKQVIFTTPRNRTFDVYGVPIDLSRDEQLLLDAENNMRTMDWPEPALVVLREQIPEKGMDLRLWSGDGGPETVENLLDGADDELAPAVSPDGKWMAYVSNYSGPDEIYVTSFPTPGARSKISTSGGTSPCWSPDGRTLFYLEGLTMIAVRFETDPGFSVVSRQALFDGEYVQYRWSRQYDVHPDGTRFLMVKTPPQGHIEVITNWVSELVRNAE